MAHLHFLLATQSDAAVLYKYGPGRVTSIVGWDRKTDKFQRGQSLKKRIDWIDLSPKGEYLCYWVHTQNQRLAHDQVYRGVSRTPWLKALAYWNCSKSKYGPGVAMFYLIKPGRTGLYAYSDVAPEWDQLNIPQTTLRPQAWEKFSQEAGCFLPRQRDGWVAITKWEKCTPGEQDGVAKWIAPPPHRIHFVKSVFHTGWFLRQTYWCGMHTDKDRGLSFNTYALIDPHGEIHHQPAWTCADVDPTKKRIVYAADCCLYGAKLSSSGLLKPKLLYDAKDLVFEAIKAPY